MWNIELPASAQAEIEPLIAALEAEGRRSPFFEDLACGLAPADPPAIELEMRDTGYLPPIHTIVIGYEDFGDAADIGWQVWTERATAAFWHEIGHALHSRAIKAPADDQRLYLLQHLEDIRSEQRLIETYGERARAWLRFNALNGKGDYEMAREARARGWALVASTFAGRMLAGSAKDEDVEVLTQRFPEVQTEIDALEEAWTGYASLADDELGLNDTAIWIDALAARVK
jgi:hypothetical protein